MSFLHCRGVQGRFFHTCVMDVCTVFKGQPRAKLVVEPHRPTLPVGVSVAHGVVTRILLVLLVHFKADSLNAPLLCLVLLAAIIAGRQRGRLVWIVHQRAPLLSLELSWFSDG